MQIFDRPVHAYLLISDATSQLLKRWLLTSTPAAILFAVMFIGHVFEYIMPTAMIWFCACVMPMPILLFIAWVQNQQPDKLVPRAVFNILLWMSSVYLVVVFLVLFSVEYWLQGENNHSVESLLAQSCWMLLPWNALLLMIAWMLMFQKKPIIRLLRGETVTDYVIKQEGIARKRQRPIQEQAYHLLVQSDFSQVFKILEERLANTPEFNELIVLKSDYVRAQKALDFHTEDPAAMNRNINRITLTLAEWIERCL